MAVVEEPHVEPQASVLIDLRRGEFLRYEITALGSTPVFTLADDRGRVILTSDGVPPTMTYQRQWPVSPTDDPVPSLNQHSIIGLLSDLVTQYTYKVELCKKDGSVKKVVIHSDYKSVEPKQDDDQFRRNLGVKVQS